MVRIQTKIDVKKKVSPRKKAGISCEVHMNKMSACSLKDNEKSFSYTLC